MSDDRQKEEFIEKLYRAYYMDLKRYALHYFHNDSRFKPYIEDCIQETFAKALTHYDSLRNSKNAIGWIFKTCRNELCECLRKYAKQRKHFEGQIPVDADSAAADCNDLERWIRQHEAVEDIRTLYEVLSPLEQNIFEDYYVQNCSLKETANKQGMTENAVNCGARRIRQKAVNLFKKNIIFIFLIATTFAFFHIV